MAACLEDIEGAIVLLAAGDISGDWDGGDIDGCMALRLLTTRAVWLVPDGRFAGDCVEYCRLDSGRSPG